MNTDPTPCDLIIGALRKLLAKNNADLERRIDELEKFGGNCATAADAVERAASNLDSMPNETRTSYDTDLELARKAIEQLNQMVDSMPLGLVPPRLVPAMQKLNRERPLFARLVSFLKSCLPSRRSPEPFPVAVYNALVDGHRVEIRIHKID